MNVFVTGTDTDVGKTLISAWLCLHTQADYWKPVQCGVLPSTDSETVATLAGVKTHPEVYRLQLAASPHLAAQREGVTIDLGKCQLPTRPLKGREGSALRGLVIEGAGGLLVPLNRDQRVIDLIAQLQTPVLLVARSTLGTINHTCLSLQALRAARLPLLGVILCGESNADNKAAIEHYGDVQVLAEFPQLKEISRASLQEIPLPAALREALQ